ncbi:MAG: RNA-binding S4 domain-containing protein [Bauldia sp.]
MASGREVDPAEPADRQRIDRWLWHARVVKTRNAAQALATSGQVRVNREKTVASSRNVRVGDVLTIALAGSVRILRVTGFAERRGSPAAARLLYEDLNARAAGGAADDDAAG